MPPRDPEELDAFRRERKRAALSPLVVHACYLINPCSESAEIRRKGRGRLRKELELAAQLGADFYVLHPGSNKNRPLEWTANHSATTLAAAADGLRKPPCLLLENTASAHGPGGSWQATARVLDALRDDAPHLETGVAIDSCHAFAAGYDFHDAEEVERLAADVKAAVGLSKLRLLHVNDARDPAGSRRDRHEHIGRGAIGRDGLGNLLRHPAFGGLPLILETPWESVEVDRRNLGAVLKLLDD